MNVTIEEVNSIKRKLTVELPEETALTSRKKHLDAYTRKARLKGFRPGKAPRAMVAKIYADELRREVLEELVSEYVPNILTEHKLEPLGLPMLESVDYQEGQPFKFTVSVELKPVFDTPQWKGLELEKVKTEITEEMVDKKVQQLRFSLGVVKKLPEDRPLDKGDLANITYQGYDGEKPVAQIKAGPFNVELGSDRLTPEFEAGLLGMRAGETKDIMVAMPQDIANKQLAGKEIALRTTLNEIRWRELPELDDELAKDLGLEGVETLAALKERIKADLDKEQKDQDDRLYNQQLTTLLAKSVTIDLPSVMVESEVNSKVEIMRRNFSRNGLDFSKMGLDLALLRERFRPSAEKSVTAALVLDQIARDNNIQISDEDIEKEFQEMSRDYGQPPELLRDYYQSKNLMDNLREGLRIGKTLELIKAEAKIVEVEKIDPEKLGADDDLAARSTGLAGPEGEPQEAPAAETAE